jgi:hypothetical protein
MKSIDFSNLTGLDVRNLPDASNPESLASAQNVEVTTGKGLRSRDQLRLHANVAAGSKGLYVVNDQLRCALPYPALTGAIPRPPVDLTYDLLVDRDGAAHVAIVEDVEAVVAWDNQPYICARETLAGTTIYRHYYIPADQAADSGQITVQAGNVLTMPGLDPTIGAGATVYILNVVPVPGAFLILSRIGDVVTFQPLPVIPALTLPAFYTAYWPKRNQVGLPFEPGPPLALAAQKVFAPDVLGRNVFFSSTEFGPTNWTAIDDAGFLPTSRNVDGDQPIRGLGVYRTQLAVFFDNIAQVWIADPDPENMEIVASIGGAGTKYPGSVENIAGDLFYFSNGAFRSMSAIVTTGQPKEDDIGSFIQNLTKELEPTSVSAVWAPWRQQYICVFDNIGYVFTYSTKSGVAGWGQWKLPWPVSAVVEWRNKIYVRRADAPEIWVMDPDELEEAGYTWNAVFNFSDGGAEGYIKSYMFVDTTSKGGYRLEYGFDPADASDYALMFDIPATGGSKTFAGKQAAACVALWVQARFSGAGPWQLDSFTQRFTLGNYI